MRKDATYAPVMDDILPFSIPAFTRTMWISRAEQLRWEPIFQSIRSAIQIAQIRSVADATLPAALVSEPVVAVTRAMADEFGLVSHQLRDTGAIPAAPHGAGRPATFLPKLIALPARLEEAKAALASGDEHSIGQALGYPDCCSKKRAFRLDDRARHLDIWQMAADRAQPTGKTVEVHSHLPATNILLASLRISAVNYTPCSFGCTSTSDWYEKIVRGNSDVVSAPALDLLEEILRWPMEWSACHGIGEVKTPFFKLTFSTMATAGTYTVRLMGSGYPEKGAKGLSFPYSLNMKHKSSEVTASSGGG